MSRFSVNAYPAMTPTRWRPVDPRLTRSNACSIIGTMTAPPAQRIADLQQRVIRMQGTTTARTLPIVPALAGVIELRTGSAYAVDSLGLAMALMAGPSRAGEWSAVVGAPDFGFDAAVGFGVDLERTVVVPEAGEHWMSVTAGLVDVASVVLVRPPAPVTEQQAERLRARLRQKDALLICWGDWPRCEVRLSVQESLWLGLGHGHGHLSGRRAVVSVSRSGAPARTVAMWLPGTDQVVAVDDRPLAGTVTMPAEQAG